MEYCMELARDGDNAAISALVDELRPRLTRMAAYYARRTGEDPDDLLQEAWFGLLEALKHIDLTIGTPEQYLVQRARWRLLDAIKRARVRRCLPIDESVAERLTETPIDGALASAHVGEFVGGLKASQRAVVACLLDGMTWREAGDRLGCTSANIAYHVRQIRRKYETWSGESVPAEAAV